MANIFELTPEQQAELAAWKASRPPIVQEMIESHPINKLYRMKSTGQRVTLLAYSEDRTVRVAVTGKYNAVLFDTAVFGIPIDDLEECELPSSEEINGTAFTKPLDIAMVVDVIRPLVLDIAQKTRLTKELHDKSGLGLMKSRMVLIAHDWDIEAAIKTVIRQSNERNRW